MNKTTKIFLVVLFLLFSLLPHSSASANSPPPPVTLWFTFDYPSTSHPIIQKAKIIFCADNACSSSVELAQTPNNSGMDYFNELYCYENWCKWRLFPPTNPYSTLGGLNIQGMQDKPARLFFRMDIQFSDRERISNIFYGIPTNFGGMAYYKIEVGQQDMSLALNKSFSDPTSSGDHTSFLLTLLVEPPVFALMVFVLKKEKFRDLLRFFLLSLSANIISYPMLWTFFTSITIYHSKGTEEFGLICLWIGLFFSALLFLSMEVDNIRQKTITGGAIVFLVFACSLNFLFNGFHYGVTAESFATSGLSAQQAVLLTEISAVIYEGAFIYFMSRKRISILQAFLMCFVANAASYLVGLVVL